MLELGPDVGMVVALAEGAVLFAACLTIARGQTPTALHYLLTTMLAVFGLVHLIWHDAIAQLLPEFVPVQRLAVGHRVAAAGSGVRQHLREAGEDRISIGRGDVSRVDAARPFAEDLADPSTGEFAFAAMAVALAGCLIRLPGVRRSVAADALATPRAQRDKAPTMPPRPAM